MTPGIIKQLDPIFKPRSIAFIGASNHPLKWGQWMVYRPLNTGFRGALYPVNLKEKEILGLPAYPRIADIPDDIDLAVITVPAASVPGVMRECAEKGVKGAIVISAGFAELDENGKALQDQVLQIARDAGIRFLGPNCMGIWSAPGRLSLCFGEAPESGGIGYVTQSGTFGIFLAQMAGAKGYGLSHVISIGNQADLSAADYIEYLSHDDHVKAIALYMEGVVDGKKFFDTAKEVIRRKPIILYKAGRTSVGARATRSHTASLAGSDEVFEAMCNQVGIIRGYETMHPFDMAEALVSAPLPKGKRVAIISGGGGHCVATADFCAHLGLEVPEFDRETQMALKAELEPHAPIPRNPVDLAGGMRNPMSIVRILEKVASLDYIDGIITMPPRGPGGAGRRDFLPPGALNVIGLAEMAQMMFRSVEVYASIPQKYGKPVILNVMSAMRGGMALDLLQNMGLPVYDTPEESARAMYALVRYAEVRRQLGEVEPSPTAARS